MASKCRFLAQIAAIFVFLCGINPGANAQENEGRSKHAVYFEAFGQGLLYSINYDYRIKPHVSVRAGFAYWSVTPWFFIMTGKIKFTGLPLMANYLGGHGKHHLELGLGVEPVIVTLDEVTDFFGAERSGTETAVLGTATIGYRLQPLESGFVFRVGLTPLFTFSDAVMSAGISAGYAF